MTTQVIFPSPLDVARGNWPAATALAGNDFIVDDGSGTLKKASQLTYASLAAAQLLLSRYFLGISNDFKNAADVADPQMSAGLGKIVEIDCVSSTFEIDDFVGGAANGGGTALEDQKVMKVNAADLAIGRVVRRQASAVTKVWVQLFRNKLQFSKGRGGLEGFVGAGAASGALSADLTLTVTSNPLQLVDCNGGARKVMFPLATSWPNRFLIIRNTSAGAFSITPRDSTDATTIGAVIAQNQTGVYYCDGVTWRGAPGPAAH